jgi:hypothetical protein
LWRSAPTPYIWEMVSPTCEKCGRRNLVIFQVEPKEAWRAVVYPDLIAILPEVGVLVIEVKNWWLAELL